MAMRAYPVRIEDGEVRSLDGTPLPRRANAVLVVLPEAGDETTQAEWVRLFREYLATLQRQPAATLEELSDDELNKLVHAARR